MLAISGYVAKIDSKVESNTHQIDTHIKSSNQKIEKLEGSDERQWTFYDQDKKTELEYKINNEHRLTKVEKK